MADGPGARIVDRVGVLVLPDTSKFQPALKKYLERVSRSARVEIGVDLDTDGLDRDVKASTKRAGRGAQVKVAAGLEDGFLSQMQRDVTAALRSIEADVPLTADGERLRRQARAKVAEIQSSMSSMALEVPLDPEASAAAKADLASEIAELQALAKAQRIDVPLGVDANALSSLAKSSGGLGGGAGGLGGGLAGPGGIAALLGGAVVGAIALGAALASLPALLMSIVGPVGIIALGWDGIAQAAKEAAPGFAALKNAVSERFATDLAPAFKQLGDALPKLIPSFTALAGALSTAFSGVIDKLTSPEGLAKVSGIIDNITEAVEILSPVLGPMVDVFLDFALNGTKAFVDNAPALLSALQTLTDLFTWLNDSGVIYAAVSAFAAMVTFGLLLVGALTAISIGLAAVWTWGNMVVGTIGSLLVGAVTTAHGVLVGMLSGLVAQLGTLPGLVLTALVGIPALVGGIFTSAMSLALSAASAGVSTVVSAVALLPALVLGALAGLGSQLMGLASSAMASMGSGISGGVPGVVGAIAGIGATIVGALAGLPGALFSAGANMISSLASGMASKLSSVASAAASAASKVKGFFPGSPVKEGPLTSWNYGDGTSGAGRRLISDLARGMDSRRREVSSAARRVAGVVTVAADVSAPGVAGGFPMSKKEMRDVLYSATYGGTAQRGRDELGRASVSPRGRGRR